MITRPTLALIYLFTPLLAGADTLDLYAELTGKTVLMASALPMPVETTVADLPTERAAAIDRLEGEFAKQGIAVLEDGPHFVILFREKQRASLTNVLSLRGAELAVTKSQDTTQAGTIKLVNMDPGTVLSIYAAISQRTILRPMVFPATLVRLKARAR